MGPEPGPSATARGCRPRQCSCHDRVDPPPLALLASCRGRSPPPPRPRGRCGSRGSIACCSRRRGFRARRCRRLPPAWCGESATHDGAVSNELSMRPGRGVVVAVARESLGVDRRNRVVRRARALTRSGAAMRSLRGARGLVAKSPGAAVACPVSRSAAHFPWTFLPARRSHSTDARALAYLLVFPILAVSVAIVIAPGLGSVKRRRKSRPDVSFRARWGRHVLSRGRPCERCTRRLASRCAGDVLSGIWRGSRRRKKARIGMKRRAIPATGAAAAARLGRAHEPRISHCSCTTIGPCSSRGGRAGPRVCVSSRIPDGRRANAVNSTSIANRRRMSRRGSSVADRTEQPRDARVRAAARHGRDVRARAFAHVLTRRWLSRSSTRTFPVPRWLKEPPHNS